VKQEHVEDLVVALLAVNQYPIEKAWALLPALRSEGLNAPATTPADLGEATVMLANAGYNRGLLTSMFAERIQNLMWAVRDGRLDGFDELVTAGKKNEAMALLCSISGIGPRVADNAWQLVTATRS